MWKKIMRIRLELIMVIVLVVSARFLPQRADEVTAWTGLMSLMLVKSLSVTLGVLYAHGSRKFLFPYLDMKNLIMEHHWGGVTFLCVWYGVIVWAFGVGG
jgi:MFS superfamily sulfate permease-like transporter